MVWAKRSAGEEMYQRVAQLLQLFGQSAVLSKTRKNYSIE